MQSKQNQDRKQRFFRIIQLIFQDQIIILLIISLHFDYFNEE